MYDREWKQVKADVANGNCRSDKRSMDARLQFYVQQGLESKLQAPDPLSSVEAKLIPSKRGTAIKSLAHRSIDVPSSKDSDLDVQLSQAARLPWNRRIGSIVGQLLNLTETDSQGGEGTRRAVGVGKDRLNNIDVHVETFEVGGDTYNVGLSEDGVIERLDEKSKRHHEVLLNAGDICVNNYLGECDERVYEDPLSQADINKKRRQEGKEPYTHEDFRILAKQRKKRITEEKNDYRPDAYEVFED